MPNDTTPAPIGADALREALGVAGYSALIGDDEIRAFARAVEATHGIKPAKEDKP